MRRRRRAAWRTCSAASASSRNAIRQFVAARRAVDPEPGRPVPGSLPQRRGGGPASRPEAARPSTGRHHRAAGRRASARPTRPRTRDAGSGCATSRETFALDALDVDLLLVALTCEVDPRFEQLFGYLNDDVTRRRPSVAVALELCGVPLARRAGTRGCSTAPWCADRWSVVDEPDRPFPGRPLRVPDRVVRHLLGDDEPEPALAAALGTVPDVPWGDPGPLADGAGRPASRWPTSASRRPGPDGCWPPRLSGWSGLGAVLLDLTKLAALPDAEAVARLAVREARLSHAGAGRRPGVRAGRPAGAV